MSAATYLIGDVHERMAELVPGSYDLIITSPPFLALRSYLPDGHPDKDKEIGSEATPAAFLDVMLALTAEWGRLLAPHGSIAIEIGDTYSGSGGDYNPGGLRDGQGKFDGSNHRRGRIVDHDSGRRTPGDGWPLAKSLAMIPELYAASLAYGRNLLTGQDSPAGRWRVRNFKPWIRSNPPVGALGDKERPATSYVTVATRATNRYFDLDAVRTATDRTDRGGLRPAFPGGTDAPRAAAGETAQMSGSNPAGAPPLDWWHQVDAIIDAEIDARAGKPATHRRAARGIDVQARSGKSAGRDGNWHDLPEQAESDGAVGARGVHIRRALERAGILATVDALDVSPKGYKGAHYAVWPMELVKLLVQEMCPHRVCTTCGQPSRRIVGEAEYVRPNGERGPAVKWASGVADGKGAHTAKPDGQRTRVAPTIGWSDCGHGTWRPGRILDPFAGSGTTLAVATGLGMDADGVDLDERNADLARERVGMFLTVDDSATAEVAS